MAAYFNTDLPLVKLRFLGQLRLAGEKFSILSFGTKDTLWHFFCFCPILKNIRLKYLGKKYIGFYDFLMMIKSLTEKDNGPEMFQMVENLILFYRGAALERNFLKELFAEFDEFEA
ncbi:uncharacterized protein LOC113466472 [Diaphorina citri]|uniref:Uncharacterized protein LOC113466472 n=1 Tax=Diaphorina citri TaxID=121845 RepID=A0A3Q0IN36_DIACI|nr:uncharacterized protein LOC113466472 [Diaphorina citri]